MHKNGPGMHRESLESSIAAAPHLTGPGSERYAAALGLARALADKLDDVEAHGWTNSAGKPDTTTAGQYLRALDAVGLTPGKAPSSPAGARPASDGGKRPLSSFRRARFEAVG